MQYLKDKFTVDMGRMNPEMCCEGCVFGGEHAWWCPVLDTRYKCPCGFCKRLEEPL
jgi:hypothetical protein